MASIKMLDLYLSVVINDGRLYEMFIQCFPRARFVTLILGSAPTVALGKSVHISPFSFHLAVTCIMLGFQLSMESYVILDELELRTF